MRLLLLFLLSLAIGMGQGHGETPSDAVERIWNTWASLSDKPSDAGTRDFLVMCEMTAREQGTSVIAPIMARAKDWKSEEVVIFVPLIAFLPFDASIPVLKQYKEHGKPWEQQCADDLLIELQGPEVRDLLKKMAQK